MHRAAADNVFGDDYFCVVFSHNASLLGPDNELRQFLMVCLLSGFAVE